MTSAPVDIALGRVPGRPATSVLVASHRLPWLATIFVLALILPTETSFMVGSLRLGPYRVVLLVAIVPLALNLFSQRYGPIRAADVLILGYALWAMLALAVHHDTNVALESGGIRLVEAFGAYVVGRACIRDRQQFRSLARLVVGVVLLVGVFTFIESVTGRHLIKTMFAATTGQSFSSSIEPRFGFHRAFGPFDHPILWGVFASSAIGLSWYASGRASETMTRKVVRTGLISVAAATSVSGGAMAAIWAQFLIIGWDYITRGQRHRWKILIAGLIAGYVFIDLVSNRSGLKVLLSYLTFSPATAYNRMIIWEWGFYQNVLPNPVFGIGFNEWVRPSWMHSTSMDNFWLYQMVTHGLPAFALLASAVIAAGWRLRSIRPSETVPALHLAWMTTMVGACVAACTVHYWNQSFVWFCLIIGLAPAISSDVRRARPKNLGT